jgi:hypothetical protein
MTNSNNDMPNLNNLEKMLSKRSPSKSSSKKSTPKVSPGLTDILGKTPSSGDYNWNYVNKALANGVDISTIIGGLSPKPAKKIAPRARKIAPKPARKIAPKATKIAPRSVSPPPAMRVSPGVAQEGLSSPDRKFGHKFEGMDTGDKDDKGRIIYAGKRGGKFVISSIGARVPYQHNKLKNRLEKGKYPFTGKVDRNGLKVFKGPRGGLFVIDNNSGKKKNPIHPLRDA